MDIRFAQRIARQDKQPKGFSATDIPLNFCLLNSELSEAFDAWRNGLEMTDELADIAILVLALAETVGADLQKAVEAKLAVPGNQEPDEASAGDAMNTATVAMRDGKLVRDKIPQIIRSKGLEPVIYQASTEEYANRLRDKLREEVDEFLASDDDPEELADILEVLYALAGRAGTDQQQLEKLRAAKASKRGGFVDRIIWSGNRPEAATGEARASVTAL
jgi:predicted house-cleaning noncanonical NTP pyrophosphatase (MazG superfamily)